MHAAVTLAEMLQHVEPSGETPYCCPSVLVLVCLVQYTKRMGWAGWALSLLEVYQVAFCVPPAPCVGVDQQGHDEGVARMACSVEGYMRTWTQSPSHT